MHKNKISIARKYVEFFDENSIYKKGEFISQY